MPVFVNAETVEELQSQIQILQNQISVLQARIKVLQVSGAQKWCHTFSLNIKVGDRGSEVSSLQTALQKEGFNISVTSVFDDPTASAVTGFQQKYKVDILTPSGLMYGTGYVGSATRAKLDKLYGCQTSLMYTPYPLASSSRPAINAGPNHTIQTGQLHTHVGAFADGTAENPSAYRWSLTSCYITSSKTHFTCPTLLNSSGTLYSKNNAAVIPGPTFTPNRDGSTYVLLLSVQFGDKNPYWGAFAYDYTPSISNQLPTPLPTPRPYSSSTIKLSSPNGGEVWTAGTTHNIYWSRVPSDPSNVDISLRDFSKANSGPGYYAPYTNYVIAHGIINSGSFTWTIPSSLSGSNFKIIIDAGGDLARPGVEDESDAPFSIANNISGLSTNLDLNSDSIVDGSDVNIEADVIAGKISCPVASCDLNNDSSVDIFDVQAYWFVNVWKDLNGDGAINKYDTNTVINVANKVSACPSGKNCDLNGDGIVDVYDITAIQKDFSNEKCGVVTNLYPNGNIANPIDGKVTLSWNYLSGAAYYNVRLDDGTSDRFDDSRYQNCLTSGSPHYYCENGIVRNVLPSIPVKSGRTYKFWVDPTYYPSRLNCQNNFTSFTVGGSTQMTLCSAPSSKNYIDTCRQSGYANACFNGTTGQYLGCNNNSSNGCTTNNVTASQNILCPVFGTTNISTSLPDLTVGILTLNTASVIPGGIISYSVNRKNIGGEGPVGNTSWDEMAYLSKDNILDSSDIPLPSTYLTSTFHLSPNWTNTLSTFKEIPKDISPGSYYLIYKVDIGGPPNNYSGFTESDENNNVTVSQTLLNVIILTSTQSSLKSSSTLGSVNNSLLPASAITLTSEQSTADYLNILSNLESVLKNLLIKN